MKAFNIGITMLVLLIASFLSTGCAPVENIEYIPVYTEAPKLPTEEPPAEEIIELIDPCGDANYGGNEVLLRIDGKIMRGGLKNKTVPPGVYKTKDKQKCEFFVTHNAEVCWGTVCQ